MIDLTAAEFLNAWNPLRQIPTLVIDRTTAIYDSRTIFKYFDQLSDRSSLMPDEDIERMTRVAL